MFTKAVEVAENWRRAVIWWGYLDPEDCSTREVLQLKAENWRETVGWLGHRQGETVGWLEDRPKEDLVANCQQIQQLEDRQGETVGWLGDR